MKSGRRREYCLGLGPLFRQWGTSFCYYREDFHIRKVMYTMIYIYLTAPMFKESLTRFSKQQLPRYMQGVNCRRSIKSSTSGSGAHVSVRQADRQASTSIHAWRFSRSASSLFSTVYNIRQFTINSARPRLPAAPYVRKKAFLRHLRRFSLQRTALKYGYAVVVTIVSITVNPASYSRQQKQRSEAVS